MDLLFVLWIIILTFPIAFTGIFIFIPTSIILCCSVFMMGCVLHVFIEKYGNGWPDNGESLGPAMSAPFLIIWAFTTIIFSSMEFYGEGKYDWINSWETGILGTYCNEDDYFLFSKFHQYNWDMQLLIVSWFIF